MERNRNGEDAMASFNRIEQKLQQAQRYRANNHAKLMKLKDDMKKVRDLMGEVTKKQNQALHQVITGRIK